MNPEIKEQWKAALKSGDYKQGRNQLRTLDNEYCCLGVLCDLAVQAGIGQWEDSPSGWVAVSVEATDIRGLNYLPIFVREWAGLAQHNPLVSYEDNNDLYRSLAGVNDASIPFSKIADIIEEQL